MKLTCHNLGEAAVLVNFEQKITTENFNVVMALCKALEAEKLQGIEAILPAYASVLVRFNPLVVSHEQISAFVNLLVKSLDNNTLALNQSAVPIEIPVCYDATFAADKTAVEQYTKLTWEAIIEKHCNKVYTVFMLGFVPGFAYLGPLNDQLFCPRKEIPAKSVATGSVAIAGNQTAIYPSETPGGWQIIGRTPTLVFQPTAPNPFLLNAGQKVVFKPITLEEFNSLTEKSNPS